MIAAHVLQRLVQVCEAHRWDLDPAMESAVALGAGATLFDEIDRRMTAPEHGLPREVVAAYVDALAARSND